MGRPSTLNLRRHTVAMTDHAWQLVTVRAERLGVQQSTLIEASLRGSLDGKTDRGVVDFLDEVGLISPVERDVILDRIDGAS